MKSHLRTLTVISLLLFSTFYLSAQFSYENTTQGVKFTLPTGSMTIRVCTDKIIQVSYCNQSSVPAKDTIVVNKV